MKNMKIKSESEMIELGQKVATHLQLPTVIELVGDVGAGKTTFTRGLAAGLGISEPVTSPSFTISKRYAFSPSPKYCKNYNTASDSSGQQLSAGGELVHYDFYRLGDPGIMRDELAETLREPNSIVVVEWGGDVAELLPEEHLRLDITLNADGSRDVTMNQSDFLEKLS